MAKELVLVDNIWVLRDIQIGADYYKLVYDSNFVVNAEAASLLGTALPSINTPLSGTIS